MYDREYHKAYAARNRESILAKHKAYYAANREAIRAKQKAYRDANKDRINKKELERIRLNPEQKRRSNAAYRAANKEKRAAWVKENAALFRHYTSRRKAAKRQATPAWANQFFIEEAYRLADLRTKMTGIDWHVDHIVPLISPLVCGLHVEHNLRVIPGVENLRKNNKHWPDMPTDAPSVASADHSCNIARMQ